MAPARLIPSTLWTLPAVAVLGLYAWAFVDVASLGLTISGYVVLIVLVLGFAATLLGLRFGSPAARRFGLVLVVLLFLGVHLTVLPLDAAGSLAFLSLALLAVEFRILADRFVPLYTARLEGADRERVEGALVRSLLRVLLVCGVAFLGSVLTADLALAGTLPATSIPTALVLAAALIAVILLLALWPLLERRAT